MRISKRYAVMGALLALVPSVHAQPNDLQTAYLRVVETHPAVTRSEFEIARQSARVDIAASVLKPQFELSATENRVEQETLASESSFNGQTHRATASQAIVDLERWENLKREQTLVNSLAMSLENVKERLALQLTERYVNVIRAQSRLNAIDELVESLEKRRSQAIEMNRLGQLSRLDLLRVQSRLAERRAEYSDAKSAVDTARAALLEIDPEIKVDGAVSPQAVRVDWPDVLDRSTLLGSMLNNHPEVAALEKQIEAEQFGLRAIERRRLPRLGLSASYEESNIGSNNRQISDTNTTVFALTLTVPLYRGGALGAEQAEQAARVGQLETDREATKRFLVRSLDEAIARFANARSAATAEAENVRGQLESVNVLEQAYERGAVSQSELLDALDNLANAKISRDQVILNGLLGWVTVRVLSGQFQPSDLSQVDAVAAQYQG